MDNDIKDKLGRKIANIAISRNDSGYFNQNIVKILDAARLNHVPIPYYFLEERIFSDTKNKIVESTILDKLDIINSEIGNDTDNKKRANYCDKFVQKYKDYIKDIFIQKRRYVKSNRLIHKYIDNAKGNMVKSKSINRKAHKSLKKIDKSRRKIQKYKKKIKKYSYSSIISILGIFTAITFATFGGLQLLANVFGHIKEFDDFTVGNSIILGSVYIFSVYLILIILFNGISMLSNKKGYKFDINLNMYVLSSIVIIFIIGFMYAHFSFVQLWTSFSLVGIGLLVILIIVYINFKCYKDTHVI